MLIAVIGVNSERLRMVGITKFFCGGLDGAGNWKVMTEEDVRKELSKRGMTMSTVLAVLYAWQMWGGGKVEDMGDGRAKVDTDVNDFGKWLMCLLNGVIDQEACDFLKRVMKTDVQPDPKDISFEIPLHLQDDRIRKAREKAALLNYERRLELQAKKNFRDNVRKRLAERAEEEGEPARQKSRWDDAVPFAVEETPDTWEDRVSLTFLLSVCFHWIIGGLICYGRRLYKFLCERLLRGAL